MPLAIRLLPLSHATEITDVGAKAHHLNRVLGIGHRVPPGVVVPASALADGVTRELHDALREALHPLGEGPWAVRSSGIAEDGAEHSFAGQVATVLHVSDDDTLERALKECLQSASGNRITSYGQGNQQPLAIIVQRQVAATTAGVAFSANPVTGARDEVVIHAVPGLGDKLVHGDVTPDEVTVTGDTVTGDTVSGSRTRLSGLTDAQARELATVVRHIATQFDAPEDVEWAFEDGTLHILQARPITALPPAPIPIPVTVPPGTWMRNDHHTTLSPMAFGLFCADYDAAQAEAMRTYAMPVLSLNSRMIGGHLYTQMATEGGDQKGTPPNWVMWLAARLVPQLRRMNRQAELIFREQPHHAEMRAWEDEWKPYFQEHNARLDPDALAAMDDETLVAEFRQLKRHLQVGLRAHARTMGNWIAICEFGVFCREHLSWDIPTTLRAMGGWSKATTAVHDELTALCRQHVSAADARAVSGSGANAVPDLLARNDALRSALEEWQRANRLRIQHYDFHNPTLGETPELVERQVRDILTRMADGRPDPSASVHAERERLHADARRALEGSPLWSEFETLADWARRAYSYRDENGQYTISPLFGMVRLHLLEMGRRMPHLGAPAHIFYLTPDELEPAFRGTLTDMAARIERRRGEEQWAKFHRGPRVYGPPEAPMPPVDAFPAPLRKLFRIFGWMMDAEMTPPTTSDAGGDTLPGHAASAGVYTGTARVITGPQDFHRVLPGDVVVSRITSGEWSMIFGRVGALVTDEGSMLSHPAIIAREFGIPAVVNTDVATQRIPDGATVTVDGGAGRVTISREDSAATSPRPR